MRRSSQTLAVLAVASLCTFAAGVQAADYPFVGKWDCEVAEFSFTGTTYDNGMGETLTMSEIEPSGDDFILAFPDGYRIALMDVTKNTMTWSSQKLGDTFVCHRVD